MPWHQTACSNERDRNASSALHITTSLEWLGGLGLQPIKPSIRGILAALLQAIPTRKP